MIDEQYTQHPFYGVRRMTKWLRLQGCAVNKKRVSRLMRRMGLQAIYPKPRLSQGTDEHKKYPYLLNGLAIDQPNQVWCNGHHVYSLAKRLCVSCGGDGLV